MLDEFSIYNKALSAGEAASLAGLTQTYYLFTTAAAGSCDLNKDGVVNAADQAILDAAMGYKVLWP